MLRSAESLLPRRPGSKHRILRSAELHPFPSACAEDIRSYPFPPMVPRDELLPSPAQHQAAQALVRDMDLTRGAAGAGELLKPEATANPLLQRFYRALGKLALGQEVVQGQEEEVGGAGTGRRGGGVLSTPGGEGRISVSLPLLARVLEE